MKNNIGLIEHCETALKEGWGYVWGTYGKVLTPELLEQKLLQYPDNIKKYEDYIRKNYIGKRAADCVGLIKSFIWWDGNNPVYAAKTDVSANGMYEASSIKGSISELPELPGVCLWKNGHVGVYIGNGRIIEAKGTKYGIVETQLKGWGATKWTHWFFCPFIDYVSATAVYKTIILKNIPFTDPDGIWDAVYTHKHPQEWLRKWAESYKR